MARTIRSRKDRPSMAAERFEYLCTQHVLPTRPASKMALYARAVLVNGEVQSVVAERHGVTRQAVTQAVNYFKTLDADLN